MKKTLIMSVSAIVMLAASQQVFARDGFTRPAGGAPTCGQFFDKWDLPGVPAGMLAAGGLGREVFAARDCIEKKNVPIACEHWRRSLVGISKIGPSMSDSRRDIDELMRQHNCDRNAQPSK